ncbi:MAG: deoxynucleoside kinase, partial [Spirochaetales bacterium]|nr:deoxynucleoside kinase [Spirochaetales bacterium]
MSIHIALLGIDGSGKSSVSSTLPALLAAELKVSAGSAGEEFRITTADGDHLGPSFDPKSLPLSIRLSKYFKKKAKKNVDNRKLYQVFKVAHMLFQDSSARKLESTYDPSIIISDGNAILSACGREINYRKVDGVSPSTDERSLSTEEMSQLFEYLVHDESIPASTIAKMEKIRKIRKLKKVCSFIGLDTFWLPDFVFFLDISPEEAMRRIKNRGNKIDRHENITDLNNAREMYLKTLNALSIYRKKTAYHSIQVDKKSPGEVLNEIVSIVKKKIKRKDLSVKRMSPLLGKAIEDLENKNFLAKILNRNYIINYLIKKFFKGAWREPLFICS